MNKICKTYCDMINSFFPGKFKTIIIYGSNIYNESSSDLDVCLITDDNEPDFQKKVIDATIQFHIKNNLKVDEEIPFSNKLIYTVQELDDTLKNHPFLDDGHIVIHDIVKSEEFLSSSEMKKRLLLNILTTDHLSVGDSTKKYESAAFKIIMNVIISYFKLDITSEDEILECMYTNKYTGASGEMYLGYKRNYQKKDEYLRKKIHEALK